MLIAIYAPRADPAMRHRELTPVASPVLARGTESTKRRGREVVRRAQTAVVVSRSLAMWPIAGTIMPCVSEKTRTVATRTAR
jgi:hypothetical protein